MRVVNTVLITGASSGIGKETARVYAEKGYNLILVARREAFLKELQQELQGKYNIQVEVIPMDLAQTDSADLLFQKIKEQNLKTDVLINNAGFGLFDDFLLHDETKLEQMMVLNMVTLTKMCQLFGKEMANAGGGNIINIASTAAFQPMPGLAVYAATKAYVMNLSDALAYELKKQNITVTCINPGATNSEFAKVANFTSETLINDKSPSSREVAEYIFDSMEIGRTNATHGLKNKLMAWSNRLVPRKVSTIVAARMLNK